MFCGACIKTEHERGFDPVARHRRMLMAEVNNPHSTSCAYHPRNRATLYSITLQQFACNECDSRSEFAEMKDKFEPIDIAVKKLRSQAKGMVQYSQDILAKLNLTLVDISANNAELGPAVERTKNQIQAKFSEIMEIINERQQTLMKHVQTEVCMYMYIYMYMCMCVHVYALCVCVGTCACVNLCECMCNCVHKCTMYMYMYVHTCMYVHAYACAVHVCVISRNIQCTCTMYILYMYMYMYIYNVLLVYKAAISTSAFCLV